MSLQKLLSLINSLCGVSGIGEGKEMHDKGLIPVLIGSYYSFSPQLYEQAALDFPMMQRSWLSGVGHTSADICRVLETADSRRTVLLSGVIRMACMDFARGVSVPFPNSVIRPMSSGSPPAANYRFPSVVVPESAPEGSFSTTVKVRYEDVDFHWHSNFASYVAFVLECAAQAVEAGYCSRIRADIAFYRALSLACVHLGQSFAGDDLNVSMWEDSGNAMLLHFLITRERQRIYYIKIEYEDNAIISKL